MKSRYRLLNAFASLFEGKAYLHRDSVQNDFICVQLFEDLFALDKSPKLKEGIGSQGRVVNKANRRHGVRARRGDGSFGELVPGEPVTKDPEYLVGRGVIATIEIGCECKIFNKAMVKQYQRVQKDLKEQVEEFGKGTGSRPITVAVVGINHADHTVGYEGERAWPTGVIEKKDPTTGKIKRQRHAHPIEEAPEIITRLTRDVVPLYDDVLFLRYKAINEHPFPFEWVDAAATERDYAALLTRISREYEKRF